MMGGGLAGSMAAGEAVDPIAVEESVLSAAETASAHYASLAASWRALLERTSGGGALSFVDAFAVQSQLAYAENLISPAVTAGEIVTAARAADEGWEDPAVRAMMADQPSCRPGAAALRSRSGLATLVMAACSMTHPATSTRWSRRRGQAAPSQPAQ